MREGGRGPNLGGGLGEACIVRIEVWGARSQWTGLGACPPKQAWVWMPWLDADRGACRYSARAILVRALGILCR